MTTLKIGRIAAVVLSAGTFGFLFLTNSWRADNLFLVPDLILCVALLGAAALPDRIAVPALLAAYCFSAGVLVTAVASYAVDGRLGIGSLVGAAGSLVMATVFLRMTTGLLRADAGLLRVDAGSLPMDAGSLRSLPGDPA